MKSSGDKPEAGPVRYRWLVFVILAAVYFMVYFHRQAPAVLALDFMRDFKIGGASLGMLTAAYFYPYALMQLPAGFISHVWGPRHSLAFFFSLAGLGSLLFSWAGVFTMAVLSRALVGIGVAVVLVPILDLISRWFRRSEFVHMVGILLAMGGLGSYAGATPLVLLDAVLGWRCSFLVIGVASLILAFLVWLLVRDTPQQMGFPAVEVLQGDVAANQRVGALKAFKTVVTDPGFWPPVIWVFFSLGIFISFGGLWGGPYLMHVYGLGKGQTGAILSMLALGMILGSPAIAFVSEKVLHSCKKLLMGAGTVLVLLTAVMTFNPSRMSLISLYVWFFAMSLASMAVAPLAITNARERFPVSVAGIATGTVNCFALLGGAVMQPVFGWILDVQSRGQGVFDATHYGRGFQLYLCSAVVAFIATLFIREANPPVSKDRNRKG